MINRTRTRTMLAALATLSASVAAQDVVPIKIAEKFKALYPNTRFSEIRPAPIRGVYEVVMGDNVAYTDAVGRYFIFGHLFDMQDQVDLTAQRDKAVKKVEFPTAYLHNAIKTVHGDGSRQVALFSDPDCQYCKQAEVELAKLDNVTIYTFLYPLESLHPAAVAKAVAIWCSPDRAKSWQDAMSSRKPVPLVACSNPIADNVALGMRLGVLGTPTFIAQDGRLLPGAAPADKIDLWLGAAK